MTIERTKNEVIFRLPNNINLDDLQDFADYFKYRTIAKKSKATQTEVDNLVKEIKKGRWDTVVAIPFLVRFKSRFFIHDISFASKVC